MSKKATPEKVDVLLLLYACGWALAEASDLLSTVSWRYYIRDTFNVVDIVLIVGMLSTLGTRLAASTGYIVGEDAQALMLPCQAVTAWLAWLRLLQVLFIFPKSGPLLIMTIRMLEDLWQVGCPEPSVPSVPIAERRLAEGCLSLTTIHVLVSTSGSS